MQSACLRRRLFASMQGNSIKLTLMSKPNCCLCDQAEFAIRRMLLNVDPSISARVKVETVDIESDPRLIEEYGLTIPVVLVDGEIVTESKTDPSLVRRALLDRLHGQR